MKELAKFKAENGDIYFKVHKDDKALIELEDAAKIYPREDVRGCGEFLIKCIDILYKNNRLYFKTIKKSEYTPSMNNGSGWYFPLYFPVFR